MVICYCENKDCHQIFDATVLPPDQNVFDGPLLPCGHRVARVVFSAVALRDDESRAEEAESEVARLRAALRDCQ